MRTSPTPSSPWCPVKAACRNWRLTSCRAVRSTLAELRQQLHATLRLRLPSYMVPAYIERSTLCRCCPPTRPTARICPVHRGRASAAGAGGGAVPPETPVESEIAAAWGRVFGHEVHSVEADFFLDLGGHSLFAALAVSDLRQHYGLAPPRHR